MMVNGHLEVNKLRYLQHHLADFDKILCGGLGAMQKFKFNNFKIVYGCHFEITHCDKSNKPTV